jgi:hypothetical protein
LDVLQSVGFVKRQIPEHILRTLPAEPLRLLYERHQKFMTLKGLQRTIAYENSSGERKRKWEIPPLPPQAKDWTKAKPKAKPKSEPQPKPRAKPRTEPQPKTEAETQIRKNSAPLSAKDQELRALFASVAASQDRLSKIKKCPTCGRESPKETAVCPNCGVSLANVPDARYAPPLFSFGAKCPMCNVGTMVRMGAGERGRAFGSGNLIGAFSKSHCCDSCGYLA